MWDRIGRIHGNYMWDATDTFPMRSLPRGYSLTPTCGSSTPAHPSRRECTSAPGVWPLRSSSPGVAPSICVKNRFTLAIPV